MATILVQVAHEGDQSTLEVKGYFAVGTLVAEVNPHTPVQVGPLAETLCQDVEVVVACLHHFQVRQEGGDSASVIVFYRIHLEQRGNGYASFVTLTVENAFAFDIDLAPLRQGVY